MNSDLIAKVEGNINAPKDKVWEALTDPTLIKQYFFGTDVVTDWREGSPIVWRGEWQGKVYEDKGVILKVIPGSYLESTYWSSMSGLEDKPENYKKVTYELDDREGGTRLVITQDNNDSVASMEHSVQNWKIVLSGLKKLVEEGGSD